MITSPEKQNLSYLFIGELPNMSRTSLSDHVAHIIHRCSDEQMVRSHARPIVAMMANEHFSRYLPVMNCPRYSVNSVNVLPSIGAIRKIAISFWITFSGPIPACFGFLNISPKTFLNVFRKMLRIYRSYLNVMLHSKLVLLCHASGFSRIAEAFCSRNYNPLWLRFQE